MKNRLAQISDERTQLMTGKIAVITLILTQLGLFGVILYRIYALGQSNAQISDLRLLLFLSVLGYFALRLYFTSSFPVPSLKAALGAYLLLCLIIFIGLRIWLGPLDSTEWYNTILPVVLGPVLIIGLYSLFAFLGKKRLEKELER